MRKISTITVLLTALIGVTLSYAQLAPLWNTGQTTSFATGDDGNLPTSGSTQMIPHHRYSALH